MARLKHLDVLAVVHFTKIKVKLFSSRLSLDHTKVELPSVYICVTSVKYSHF